jgi:hypothetical protein
MTIPSTEKTKVSNALKAFHDDEGGMETLQVVMLVGIAAIVLIVVKLFWNEIRNWVVDLWTELKDPGSSKQFKKSS